jgi:SAM-dependent methyltransferase
LHARPVRTVAGGAIETPPCPVCGATRSLPRFEVSGVASCVVQCGSCGLGRFDPMPGADEIRTFYPDEYYGEPGAKFQPLVERLVRLVGARHIRFLCRGLPAGARVLDVGCGRGVLLAALADRGLEVHGVEHSAEAARGADPRAEIRLATYLDEAGYAAGYFDEIIIWHVLEHLDDPRRFCREAHRLLVPGGRLIVAVPNFASAQARLCGSAWFHLDLPRPLYHYPVKALCSLLRDHGFTVEGEHHFSLRQNPFGWIQSAQNRIPGLPRNGLYTLMHRRAQRGPEPFGAGTRWLLWLILSALAPFALALAVVEALLGSGATIHLVARKAATPPLH